MITSQQQTAFKNIFPNGDINQFLHYLKFWNNNIDFALWSYGEIRFNDYKKEKQQLRNALELV